jgi:hypothetical protein
MDEPAPITLRADKLRLGIQLPDGVDELDLTITDQDPTFGADPKRSFGPTAGAELVAEEVGIEFDAAEILGFPCRPFFAHAV